ncbi:MAG TPA: hypothetical protein VHL54_08490 [Actinomycetota bacterium]|nr:hypothetical protein [Actinomycetota bacterium]
MSDETDEPTTVLPEDVDPALSFFSERCGGNDFLYDSHWHTHPGRMSAYCPHSEQWPDYRISVYELPRDLPVTTRYWVEGFMAGNLPTPPEDFFDWEGGKFMAKWRPLAAQFVKTGYWPNEDLLRDYMEGRCTLPLFGEKTERTT